jgi:hypothetical protein
MGVFLDLSVSLRVDIAGGYQDTELPVTQSGDKARPLSDADCITQPTALRLKREVEQD